MATHDGGGQGQPRVPRRLMLQSLATSAVLLPACGTPPAENPAVRAHAVARATPVETPIRVENRRLGTDAFVLNRPSLANEVEAYASAASAQAGDSIELSVSVTRAQSVRWELYRLGHYQGKGARLVSTGAAAKVAPQPMPVPNHRTGLIECAWEKAFSIVIDPSWVTGYYMFKLINEDSFDTYVPLIVRESNRTAQLLVQASVTTWQAYNLWGGLNLYSNLLPHPAPFSADRAYRVSFDRPYYLDSDFGAVEHSMVRWLEKQGYDVAYATNIDIDASPELLNDRLLFMPLGHDEYWSVAERDAVQKARDGGLSVAFFSGNTAYRRIRLDASSSGAERRVITCYKSVALDPRRNAPDTTVDFGMKPVPRPENELVGLVWSGWAHMEGFPFVVSDPDHWVYEGTGVKAGDSLGNIVGYEWDRVSNNSVSPANLEIISESPVLHEYGFTSIAHATVYYPTPKSFVFAAGTIGWARGLADPRVVNPRVQRVTENVLLRAGLFPEAREVVASPPPRGSVSATHSLVVAGTGRAGYADGAALSAQLSSPAGVAIGPGGELYVCDTGNRRIRKITVDGHVSTLVGNGAPLHLNLPTGIVVDGQGNVFVSDTGNHCIFLVTPDGAASVFAGHPRAHGLSDAARPEDARFNQPHGLALDATGALYIADFRNDAVRRLDSSGVTTVVKTAGGPTAVTVGPDGTLYYLSTWYGGVISVSPSGERKVLVNPSQVFGDQDGPGADAAARPADGLAWSKEQLVFCDVGNNRLRSVAFDDRSTVSTVAGSGRGGNGVGMPAETELCLPRGLCAVAGGYVVADSANHRILYIGV